MDNQGGETTVTDEQDSKWEAYAHLQDHTSSGHTALVGFLMVLYVAVGAVWMSTHMPAGASILDVSSVARFLGMIFLWPLYAVGLLG